MLKSVRTTQSRMIEPQPIPWARFDDAAKAVDRLELIYERHTAFIRERFADLLKATGLTGRVRATYPAIRIETSTFAKIDSRFSYGHVAGPGVYATTVTQPALFRNYLTEQIKLLVRAHGTSVEVGPSNEPIPLHFAFPGGIHIEGQAADKIDRPLRDIFDVPDLAVTDDAIVNGTYAAPLGAPMPHPLQRPRSMSQLRIGMFSPAEIWCPHFGQRDLGFTTERPSGQRLMATFRNEPKLAPNRKTNAAKMNSIMPEARRE